ncbi:MAG: hypothetical protein LBF93_04295 [Zoogloeaceae bacterium]|jgi:hypothetical protein|nr:hypothetical protein [Zoogloeaceae bacterium]
MRRLLLKIRIFFMRLRLASAERSAFEYRVAMVESELARDRMINDPHLLREQERRIGWKRWAV